MMKTKKGLFVTYEEAVHICDKNQYREASIWELVKLNLRMIHCSMTRAYSRKNGILTKMIRKVGSIDLSLSEKQTMKDKIDDYLSL